MNGVYNRRLSRKHPGLIVILLDQSQSMEEIEASSGLRKADIVTRHVNLIIQRMIDFAPRDSHSGNPRKYVYVCVIGYNDDAEIVLPTTDIAALDNNVPGKFREEIEEYDEFGNFVRTLIEEHKVWITPRWSGNTDMGQAFQKAEQIITAWLNSPPEFISQELGRQSPRNECFPPVVINITDAKNNARYDPSQYAERVRALRTSDGNVLVCNCHITHRSGQSCIFPHDIAQLRLLNLDQEQQELAERMFRMSSVIPATLLDTAQKIMGMDTINAGARCFVFNADPDVLIRFLRWGTLSKQ
jgi:uncharacterized protein YegL